MKVTAARWFGVEFLLLAAVLGSTAPAQAQDIPGYGGLEDYDAREVALLPKFCPHTLLFKEKVPGGSNPLEIERWEAVLGPTFRHMHHYCWGLMKTNRGVLLSRDRQVRQGYLTDSIREFDYVIQRAPADFVLLPEILTKKGENLIRLGRAPVGIVELERAVELKPDYWPPYAQISDYYKSVGDRQKAKEALQRGLTASPDAPALRRRLTELGGG
jgi:tetratricopeptide (TPR) repeat protein